MANHPNQHHIFEGSRFAIKIIVLNTWQTTVFYEACMFFRKFMRKRFGIAT